MRGVFETTDIRSIPFSDAPLLSVAIFHNRPYLICEGLDGRKSALMLFEEGLIYDLENGKVNVGCFGKADELTIEVLGASQDFVSIPYRAAGWLFFTDKGAAISTGRKDTFRSVTPAFISLIDGKEIETQEAHRSGVCAIQAWRLYWTPAGKRPPVVLLDTSSPQATSS